MIFLIVLLILLSPPLIERVYLKCTAPAPQVGDIRDGWVRCRHVQYPRASPHEMTANNLRRYWKRVSTYPGHTVMA